MARILVDMDGTIADWGKEYDFMLDTYISSSAEETSAVAAIPRAKDQTVWDLHTGLSQFQGEVVSVIMDYPGFYARLEPIEGAIDALKSMVEAGHEVILVTSPWLTNPTCITDKFNWVAKHLGAEWAQRVIITKDKTHVAGDILIDDKPEIKGTATPTWKHVLFDQPYNVNVPKGRITSWLDLDVDAMLSIELQSIKPLKGGEVRTVSASGGAKGVKPQRYDLIPVYPMDLLAELYGNGAAKYAAHNWRNGYEWSNSYSAAMRHMTTFWNGEDNDPEMGLPHVTSAAFHMFALAQFMRDFPEYDDRFKAGAKA